MFEIVLKGSYRGIRQIFMADWAKSNKGKLTTVIVQIETCLPTRLYSRKGFSFPSCSEIRASELGTG